MVTHEGGRGVGLDIDRCLVLLPCLKHRISQRNNNTANPPTQRFKAALTRDVRKNTVLGMGSRDKYSCIFRTSQINGALTKVVISTVNVGTIALAIDSYQASILMKLFLMNISAFTIQCTHRCIDICT